MGILRTSTLIALALVLSACATNHPKCHKATIIVTSTEKDFTVIEQGLGDVGYVYTFTVPGVIGDVGDTFSICRR